MTTYITKRFDDLSLKSIESLRKLSFGQGGGMHSEFEAYLLHRGKEPESKCWSAVIAKDGDQFIGWVLVRHSIGHPYLMCYIKPSFRRKGIGSELINRARRYLKNVKKSKQISVFPHDFKSSKFFNKVASKHKDIYLDVWYDRPPINLLPYMI